MDAEEIHLKCTAFLPNSFNSFSQLKASGIFTDVTLVSDDNMQIEAHKIILSVGSEYFRNILSDKSHPHPMLCLDGISSEDLAWIIQYLYVGEVSVPQSSLQKFLKVANKLKCYGLDDKMLQRTTLNKIEEELVTNEVSNFEEIQVNTEVEQLLSKTDYEYLEPEDNKSGGDITSEISTEESITESVPKVKPSELCRIEGKTFSMDHLKQFLKKTYHCNEDGFFSCNYCPKIQKYIGHMTEHVQIHVRNLEFDCDKCGKTVKSFGALRSHIYRDHNA